MNDIVSRQVPAAGHITPIGAAAAHGVELVDRQFALARCSGIDCVSHCQLRSLYVIKTPWED